MSDRRLGEHTLLLFPGLGSPQSATSESFTVAKLVLFLATYKPKLRNVNRKEKLPLIRIRSESCLFLRLILPGGGEHKE